MEGTEEEIIVKLRALGLADFRERRVMFRGLPVVWDEQIRSGGTYEEGFWHLITREGSLPGVRRLDRRRAERLSWCAAILRHADDPAILVWDYPEGHCRKRTYLWFERGAYVIVLEIRERRTDVVAFLVTAFHVDGPAHERALRRKYARKLA
ncbi:MAG: hypothetical protein C4346_20100 [Chloroflexota bacterium]